MHLSVQKAHGQKKATNYDYATKRTRNDKASDNVIRGGTRNLSAAQQALNQRPQLQSQLQLQQSLNQSSAVVAQAKLATALQAKSNSAAIQRQSYPKEDTLVQGKFTPVKHLQRQGSEQRQGMSPLQRLQTESADPHGVIQRFPWNETIGVGGAALGAYLGSGFGWPGIAIGTALGGIGLTVRSK